MSDLVAFLRARLDEDEQIAGAAESAQWHAKDPDAFGCRVVSISFEVGQVTASILGGNAQHIARHDPKRELDEVEAKRRIIDGCLETLATEDAWDPVLDGGTSEPYDLARFVLLMLALPDADHPDYDEAWRP